VYQANAATLTPLSKEHKISIKSLQECKGYNAWQFITEFLNKGWTKNSINRLLVKFKNVDRHPGSGRHRAHTDKNVHRVESLLLSQENKPQSHRTVREILREAGIHRSSVSEIIHKDLHLKCFKKRLTQQLTEVHSTHVLFSVCSLRDNNNITSKPTWKTKHANSILESSEYFYQISLKLIHVISSYTVSKLGRFLRHSVHSGRDMGLSYTKEIVLISPAVWAECTNMTDQQNDNINRNRKA